MSSKPLSEWFVIVRLRQYLRPDFAPDMEHAFREHRKGLMLSISRFGLITAVVVYVFFLFIDRWAFPVSYPLAWFVRIAIALPTFIAVYFVTYTAFFLRYVEVLASFCVIVSGAGVIVMIAGSEPSEPGHNLYFAGLMLVMLWNYAFIQIGPFTASALGWLLFLGFWFGIFWAVGFNFDGQSDLFWSEFITQTAMVATTNLLGMTSCYWIDALRRKEFSRRNALRAQKEQIETRTCELRAVQAQLFESARRAGMVEVATGTLHNVGNVLSSLNTSATVVHDILADSRIEGLQRAHGLLKQNADTLADYLTNDERGKLLPEYLAKAIEAVRDEHDNLSSESQRVLDLIRTMRQSIRLQQEQARGAIQTTDIDINTAVEDALAVWKRHLSDQHVQIDRRLCSLSPKVRANAAKLTQVLVNLFKNAADALSSNPTDNRLLIVETDSKEDGSVVVRLIDNGIGIAPDDLNRVSEFGFTTKSDGNGFGIHWSATHMEEIGGSLVVTSDGIGHGACITLIFPQEMFH